MFENQEFAAWLESVLSDLFEKGEDGEILSAALVVREKDDEIKAAYYKAGWNDKALFSENIKSDMTLELILGNADQVKEALDELEEDDDGRE